MSIRQLPQYPAAPRRPVPSIPIQDLITKGPIILEHQAGKAKRALEELKGRSDADSPEIEELTKFIDTVRAFSALLRNGR